MNAGEKLIVIFFIVIALGAVGYVMNIVRLCQCDFERPVKAEVIRCVGVVVPPVGGVVGYFKINDEKAKETPNEPD